MTENKHTDTGGIAWAHAISELEQLRARVAYLEARLVKAGEAVAFLTEIGKRIAAQDNRCTDQPMFVVFQKSEIVVAEGYSHDRIVWINDEGIEADEATTAQLDDMRGDPDSLGFMEDEIELGDEERNEWRRLAVKEIDEFVTACFTDQGCKDFLEIQGHNLRKPYIYGAGSFRNVEYQQLRNLMLALAQQAEGAQS